jgi:hypothetical protein
MRLHRSIDRSLLSDLLAELGDVKADKLSS